MLTVLLCFAIVFVLGIHPTYAAEEGKKPLHEVFDRLAIVPYDYQGKAFINGQQADLYGDYRMFEKNGRVLVPIRFMGYLADQTANGQGNWNVIWNKQNPDDVILTNPNLHKTIKLTVNNKTMLVNNQPVALDVPPQLIDGRIVLPLRSTAAALEKNIDWLDGLILIGDESVDLQHPQTIAIKDKIKTQLTDTRKRIDHEKSVTPLTRYGNTSYFIQTVYKESDVIEQLFKKADGQKEVKVQVPGNPVFGSAKVDGDKLYFISEVNNKSGLYAFSFADNKSTMISSLEPWKTSYGYLGDVLHLDDELYVTLHNGELIMGHEGLLKVENGALKEVLSGKSLMNFAKAGANIYFTDFLFMSGPANNLFQVDTKTKNVTLIAQNGYAYGIDRTINENGGGSYTGRGGLYVKDGYLYTLGYNETDPKDESSVYKINLADRTHVKLTSAADDFWMAENQIFYIDASSGYLKSVELDGGNDRVLIERKVSNVTFHNGDLYYSAAANSANTTISELYRYRIAAEKEVKLIESGKHIRSFFVGDSGVYFVADGYEPGLYKIDTDGRIVSLVTDHIDKAILTDAGMIYTMTYQDGVYAGK
ncbi:DUF5050 domain-containing protein [Paenibacillus thermotolerans]|uniref:DUF5050 domain-containing protein n=1 Tax=Paenibacillus thermotolerans TaxID=3027807 RepID=UPI002367604D|nr:MULTISPECIES: DUF5050 domain-containing protein [unclassified Paenibacillus]